MTQDFWNEWREGGIHVRDLLQFELKSEFIIHPKLQQNVYKQEFFLFIPSPLQINKYTYKKEQFYLDQTNLIRYKTPRMSLERIRDLNYPFSPLHRLEVLIQTNASQNEIMDELQLFGNIFKTAMRERFFYLAESLDQSALSEPQIFNPVIIELCEQINGVSALFRSIQEKYAQILHAALNRQFRYADEFISDAIENYSIVLLQQLRSSSTQYEQADERLCKLLLVEKEYRKKNFLEPKTSPEAPFFNESILYRQGLLNRFMLEALKLNIFRCSLEEKHGNILGAIAAGIAMFVYMLLFVWKSSSFVINSFPFIMLAVIFYILKDRLKEWLKKVYYQQAYRWFPDYSTEIWSPDRREIGRLTENCALIEPYQLPPGFLDIRNHYFHEELQALHRHETILQYKKEVTLYSQAEIHKMSRRELTMIFRLNIHYFLQKASNALEPYLSIDTRTKDIHEKLLPKVYHLNIIIRNSYLRPDLSFKSEIKKFRVVIDKAGIKRVEEIK
ncbi:MAG: hypothetical protein LW832_05625 [Parachlamydia sp.]|jgi:hypothetical protein|nr:hypothetical protein [Parachlamydia sp.]